MKTISRIVCGIAVSIFGLSAPASADNAHFHANLDGLQETPPNASPGSGFADLVINPMTLMGSIHMEFLGLTAPQTAAHIHIGPVGGPPGPVTIPLTFGSPSDTFFTMTAIQYGHLTAGNLYVNVHSQNFPAGELRGQLNKVPAPASAALLGLGGLVAARRRR